MMDWHLNLADKEAKKLSEQLSSQAKKLKHSLERAETDEAKYAAVYSYYRKYYTLTLHKSSLEAGLNRSPTRDIILDFPWKDLEQNRIFCLKIWEKINH